MDFIPSRAGLCIWLRKNSKLNLYEYIAIYVDDLCIAAQNPKDGPLSYHLRADYYHDLDGTRVCQSKKSIEKLKGTC